MADVALHRAEPDRPVGPVAPIGLDQRLRLDRVPELGTGPVSLDSVEIGRLKPGTRQGLADNSLLGEPGGRCQAVRRSVLVHCAPGDHGQHTVPSGLRDGKRREHQQAHALGEPGAVGAGTVGAAATVGGQTALPGEVDEDARAPHHAHAAGERERALALAQRLSGQVD